MERSRFDEYIARFNAEDEAVLRRWAVFPNLGPEPQDCIVCAKVK